MFTTLLASVLAILALLSTTNSSTIVPRAANTLFQVTDFGSNPTNVGFYIYVPSKLQSNPPILVNPHWCHGDAAAAFAGSQFATLADTYGFIVIYPDSPNTVDKCWDVSSNLTLTHNGGGDSLGIVSMVRYTLSKYNGDTKRVYSAGTSSGAMMTNVLLGAYPDIFAAGSANAGVAFGCFADPAGGFDVWSNACATGTVIKTGAEWAAIVKAAYPEFSGTRPKMQVFHGEADTTLYPQNLQEEVKEWTAVLELPSTPILTIVDTPFSGWTKYVYGTTFEVYSAAGVGHNIPVQESLVMSWLGLTSTGSSVHSVSAISTSKPASTTTPLITATGTTSPVTSKTNTSTSSSATISASEDGTIPKWGQCGGKTWTGTGTCISKSTCTYSNEYYSQVSALSTHRVSKPTLIAAKCL